MSAKLYYCFDNYRLDAHTHVLYRDGSVVRLEPKIVDMLLFLVQHSGMVVSKEDLIKNIWPDTIVEESAVRRNISLMRSVLDTEFTGRYVETLPRQGYRFRVPVTQQLLSDENEFAVEHAIAAATLEKATESPLTSATSSVSSNQVALFAVRRKIRWFIAINLLLVLVVAGVLIYRFIVQPSLDRSVFISRQLTNNSEELPILTGAISPDGSMIAFADERTLFVGDAKAIERHALTLPQGVVPSNIEWFADSIHLLVSSINPDNDEATVWNVPILGGNAELLLRSAKMASSSFDGKHIVFLRNQNELWIANSDGSSAKLFTTAPDNAHFGLQPQFSQDDLYILYSLFSVNMTTSRIEARNIETGETVLLFDSSHRIPDFRLINNRELLLSQQLGRSSNNTQLVSIAVHLSSGFHSVARVIANATDGLQSAFSATKDGQTLLMVVSHYYSTVQVANLNKEGNELSNIRRLTLNNSHNLPSAWTPDSRSVLFFSNRSGHYNIFEQDIDSPNASALTSGDHDYLHPAISADGKWLFYFMPENGAQLTTSMKTTLVRQLTGSSKGQVVDTEADFYRGLHCATRVNKCVLSEHINQYEIFYEFDPELGKGKELARVSWAAPITAFCWDVSYDGTRIAYLDSIKGINDITVMNIAVSPVTTQSIHVVGFDPFATLSWDVYGKGFYVSSYNSSGDLLKQLHIKLDGSTEILRRQIGSELNWGIPSPDGKYLAFRKSVRKSNIWLLQRQ